MGILSGTSPPFNVPAIVRPADDLAELAAGINDAHRAVGQLVTEALGKARVAGELLLTAKKRVGHGRWLPWVRDHCHAKERTCQLYMRIAAGWAVISRHPDFPELTLQEAALAALPPAEADPQPVADSDGWYGLVRQAMVHLFDAMRLWLDDPACPLEHLVVIRDAAGKLQLIATELRIDSMRCVGVLLGLPDGPLPDEVVRDLTETDRKMRTRALGELDAVYEMLKAAADAGGASS